MVEKDKCTGTAFTPHHNSHQILSRKGATYATWLTISLLSMWFVRKSAQDQRDGPQLTQPRLTIWVPLPPFLLKIDHGKIVKYSVEPNLNMLDPAKITNISFELPKL